MWIGTRLDVQDTDMRRHYLLALPTLAALVLPAASGSGDHTGLRSPQEFSRLIGAADKAFARQDYLNAVASLREGIALANRSFREAVAVTMPAAPMGFVEFETPEIAVNPADPIGSAMLMSPNRPYERRFHAKQGNGEIRLMVAPNSPGAVAAQRALALAENDPNSEVVECGSMVGVVTRSRGGFSVRFVIGNAHLIEARAHDVDEKVVLSQIDAAFLARVTKVLGAG